MIYAFDLETIHWSEKFLCGGVYDGDTYIESWNEEEFFEILLKIGETDKKPIIYAHNGGRFDFLWLLSLIKSKGLQHKLSLQGSVILEIRVENIIFRDSHPLFMSSLDKLGEMIGRGKKKLSIPFSSFNRLSEHQKKEVSAYLKEDCVLLYDIIQFMFDYFATHNIVAKNTIGSTAWATAKEFCSLDNSKLSYRQYYRLRDGYYGGRTECYQPLFDEEGIRIDRNASYPSALHNIDLPIGAPITSANGKFHFERSDSGIYTVSVDVPKDTFIPVLPYRVDGRLFFPVGEITGTWTLLELQYAITQGVSINRIHNCVFFQETKNIFKDYIEHIWELRSLADSKALNKFLKWLANSLTGKFAQKPGSKIVSFQPENIEKSEPLDLEADYWSKNVSYMPDCAYPHWSAYLTSEARISLHKKLIIAKNPIYCDTDSVYAQKFENHIDDSETLGEWKTEGKLSEWFCIAPKAYSFYDGEKYITKYKGLPNISRDQFIELSQGATIDIGERPRLFLSGAKSGSLWGEGSLRSLKKTHRPVSNWIGGRLLSSDGKTYPPTMEDIERRKTDEKEATRKREKEKRR